MLDHFLFRATLAGLAIAIVAAPLGCFVVWRKMAYFGDATAHASILGVALALAFSMSIFAGTFLIALLMAVLIAWLSDRGHSADTLLGVLAHSALAVGLVIASLIPGLRLDLHSYLFGDILTVSQFDLLVIWVTAIVVLLLLRWRWSALLTSTLNPDLAHAAGLDPDRERLILMLLIAAVVAIAIKIVGVLLVTALLIIPAAAARSLVRTPESMALVATVIGALATLIGIAMAWQLDTPTGPSIVCICALAFALTFVMNRIQSKH